MRRLITLLIVLAAPLGAQSPDSLPALRVPPAWAAVALPGRCGQPDTTSRVLVSAVRQPTAQPDSDAGRVAQIVAPDATLHTRWWIVLYTHHATSDSTPDLATAYCVGRLDYVSGTSGPRYDLFLPRRRATAAHPAYDRVWSAAPAWAVARVDTLLGLVLALPVP